MGSTPTSPTLGELIHRCSTIGSASVGAPTYHRKTVTARKDGQPGPLSTSPAVTRWRYYGWWRASGSIPWGANPPTKSYGGTHDCGSCLTGFDSQRRYYDLVVQTERASAS